MESPTFYLVFTTTFLIGIILYYKWFDNVWARKNIPYDVENLFTSLFKEILLQRDSFSMKFKKKYEFAKAAGYKNLGLYVLGKPIYVPIDPQIIKEILSSDFQKFINRGFYYNKKSDPLSANIFALDGEEWKSLRTKVTPTFTSGKIKTMVSTVTDCGEQLKNAMENLVALNEPINISNLTEMFTTDVIGSCAFGLDCNSFTNPNSDFLKFSKLALQNDTKNVLKGLIAFRFPSFARSIGISLIDKNSSDFFLKILKETIQYRKENNIIRNDFLHLLLSFNESTKDEKNFFTFEEIAAQSFLFFLAGYETSSSTLTFFLYEVSINPEIQEKVREEIISVLKKHDGKVTYEALGAMKYMEQTINETLRKYPPLPALLRQNVEEYKIPGTNQILEKGTSIFIPSIGLHYDPEYFPDPEKFDPERFSDENKSKINPYTYLPFGEGPRNCIALRFGIVQVKVGLIYLLQNYKFSLSNKTQIPLVMDNKTLLASVLGGMWLNATKIEYTEEKST